MPLRSRHQSRLLQSLGSKSLSDLFLCPSCSQWRLSSRALLSTAAAARGTSPPVRAAQLQRGQAGTRRQWADRSQNGLGPLQRRQITASEATSIINAPDPVPPRLKELHAALEALKSQAADYINLSQLPLALRGLESVDGGVTRVAVLAFGAPQDTARRLAWLLLADALSEGQRWEEQVFDRGSEVQSGAILLRYGEEDGSGVAHAQKKSRLYREILVPSTLLQNHNLEILVSGLSTGAPVAASPQELDHPSDLILVPSLDGGSGGVVTMVRYPVHKALVVGDGAASSLQYGSFMNGERLDGKQLEMVRFTANVSQPLPAMMAGKEKEDALTFTDVDRAAKALGRFREDVRNSSEFEHGWLHSGVPVLKSWLVAGVPIAGTSERTRGHPIRPVLANLINHLVEKASANIDAEEAKRQSALQQTGPGSETLGPLEDALVEWSGKAHTELRDRLDQAFAGRSWNRASWWKLVWRVDDVSMVVQDTIEHNWLLEAESGCHRLVGRFEAAGLLDSGAAMARPSGPSKAGTAAGAGEPDAARPSGPNKARDSDGAAADYSTDYYYRTTVPWAGIGQARATRARVDGAELQAKAHRLLLQSLSTVAVSSALSGLLYLSTSLAVTEAASVAALGLVLSLRRLQRRWEGERRAFARGLREEGRLALKRGEDGFLALVAAARERLGGEGPDAEQRRRAREAVGRVRDELRRLAAGPGR